MARLQVEFAVPADAPELSRLLTESTRGFAMPAFALDRPSDVFRIMEVRGSEWKVIVARDTERGGRLAAYASVAYRPCYVNGEARRVGHLLDDLAERVADGAVAVLAGLEVGVEAVVADGDAEQAGDLLGDGLVLGREAGAAGGA